MPFQIGSDTPYRSAANGAAAIKATRNAGSSDARRLCQALRYSSAASRGSSSGPMVSGSGSGSNSGALGSSSVSSSGRRENRLRRGERKGSRRPSSITASTVTPTTSSKVMGWGGGGISGSPADSSGAGSFGAGAAAWAAGEGTVCFSAAGGVGVGSADASREAASSPVASSVSRSRTCSRLPPYSARISSRENSSPEAGTPVSPSSILGSWFDMVNPLFDDEIHSKSAITGAGAPPRTKELQRRHWH